MTVAGGVDPPLLATLATLPATLLLRGVGGGRRVRRADGDVVRLGLGGGERAGPLGNGSFRGCRWLIRLNLLGNIRVKGFVVDVVGSHGTESFRKRRRR